MSSKEEELRRLRNELGSQLTDPKRLKKPEGIPTGFAPLDDFLLWNGLPKGALTALTGELGLGATSLWLEAAARVTQQGRWVAWVDREAQLFPVTLWQKELDLSRLVTIEAPETEKKLLWLLQELMASTLFDIIGCDLSQGSGQVMLREHQLRKLEKQARSFNTALVFFAGRERLRNASLFSLVVNFRPREIQVERALQRQTPHLIPRRITYENFTIHARDRIGPGVRSSFLQVAFGGLEPSSLLGSAGSAQRKRGPGSNSSDPR